MTTDPTRSVVIQCPKCDKTGTVRGMKHHYTTIHADGESGLLQVVFVEVPRRRRQLQSA